MWLAISTLMSWLTLCRLIGASLPSSRTNYHHRVSFFYWLCQQQQAVWEGKLRIGPCIPTSHGDMSRARELCCAHMPPYLFYLSGYYSPTCTRLGTLWNVPAPENGCIEYIHIHLEMSSNGKSLRQKSDLCLSVTGSVKRSCLQMGIKEHSGVREVFYNGVWWWLHTSKNVLIKSHTSNGWI